MALEIGAMPENGACYRQHMVSGNKGVQSFCKAIRKAMAVSRETMVGRGPIGSLGVVLGAISGSAFEDVF